MTTARLPRDELAPVGDPPDAPRVGLGEPPLLLGGELGALLPSQRQGSSAVLRAACNGLMFV